MAETVTVTETWTTVPATATCHYRMRLAGANQIRESLAVGEELAKQIAERVYAAMIAAAPTNYNTLEE